MREAEISLQKTYKCLALFDNDWIYKLVTIFYVLTEKTFNFLLILFHVDMAERFADISY